MKKKVDGARVPARRWACGVLRCRDLFGLYNKHFIVGNGELVGTCEVGFALRIVAPQAGANVAVAQAGVRLLAGATGLVGDEQVVARSKGRAGPLEVLQRFIVARPGEIELAGRRLRCAVLLRPGTGEAEQKRHGRGDGAVWTDPGFVCGATKDESRRRLDDGYGRALLVTRGVETLS